MNIQRISNNVVVPLRLDLILIEKFSSIFVDFRERFMDIGVKMAGNGIWIYFVTVDENLLKSL